jgi:hypothetical protein
MPLTGHGVLKCLTRNAIPLAVDCEGCSYLRLVDPGFSRTDDYCELPPQPSRSSPLSPLLKLERSVHMETWLYIPMFTYAAKPFCWLNLR